MSAVTKAMSEVHKHSINEPESFYSQSERTENKNQGCLEETSYQKHPHLIKSIERRAKAGLAGAHQVKCFGRKKSNNKNPRTNKLYDNNLNLVLPVHTRRQDSNMALVRYNRQL